MGRTTRTPIPGLPGVALISNKQHKGSTTFALDVTRDDCVDFTLDLSANDCEVLGADGARVLHSITTRGTTVLGTVIGKQLRLTFEYAIKSLRPSSPQTVVEDVVEQGRHDNCWLLASLIAVGPRDRLCVGGLWTTTTLAPDRALAGATRRGHAHDALSVLTGCPVDVVRSGERDAEALWSFVAEAGRRKDPVVVSTRRVDDTTLAPGHAYALMDCRSLNGERYCRLRDPRGGRPATDAGAALAGDAPLASGERWVPFSEVFDAHSAVALARLASPRGAPWRVARARAALTGGGPTAALRVECDRATLLRCAVHQEDLTDLGVAVLDLSTDAIVAATVACKARTADVDVTVGPGTYAVVPTGGRFLPRDGRQNVGLVVHADVAVKASAVPATAADLASVLFAGVTHQLDGPGRLVVAQSRGGVSVVVENTDAARTLVLRLDGTGSTNLEGHAGAKTVAVSVGPGAAAHVLSAAPVQAHAAWTWDATWCASWC